MRTSFDQRIARAKELAERCLPARDLLNFYGQLALFQKSAFEQLNLNGETDVRVLLRYFPALLELVRRSGPDALIDFGEQILGNAEARRKLLVSVGRGWTAEAGEPSRPFLFSRVLFNPMLNPSPLVVTSIFRPPPQRVLSAMPDR